MLSRIALIAVVASTASCLDLKDREGAQCELNSDCNGPLACRLERCRVECATTADCVAPAVCVQDEDGFGACQLADERDCALDSECPGILVCRLQQCVNECEEDRDCLAGARCLGEDDMKGCVDTSTMGCAFDGECPSGLFCRSARCRQQCFTDRDCGGGRWQCRNDSVCCDPAVAGDAPLGCADRFDAGVGMDGGTSMDGGTGMDGGAGGDGGADGGGAGMDGGTDAGGVDAGPPLCSGTALTGVRDLSVGVTGACVVRGTGAATEVLCWGAVGDIGGGVMGGLCPTASSALAGLDIVDIDLGGLHGCVVLADGEVWCWGINLSGELGRGTIDMTGTMNLPPAVVPGITADGVVADFASTCTWEAGAPAYCWGTNLWGSLGIGPCRACTTFLPSPAGDPRPTPQQVTVVSQPQDLAMAGGGHVCGIIAGVVECWGIDRAGQLGMTAGGTDIDDAIELAAGDDYTCAVRAGDGSIHCWGWNNVGNLGDGTLVDRPTKGPVVGLPVGYRARQIDGGNHTCTALQDGSVWCWGDARSGRVRPGLDVMAEPNPQMVLPAGSGATRVEVGAFFSCAQVGDEVRCWGNNPSGQLGNGTMGAAPATVITVLAP